MSKAIYALKSVLFINQFKLTKHEENSFVELNSFVVKYYAINWFTASINKMAPNQQNNLKILDPFVLFK